jgi:hypothetical protein
MKSRAMIAATAKRAASARIVPRAKIAGREKNAVAGALTAEAVEAGGTAGPGEVPDAETSAHTENKRQVKE